MQWFLGRYTAFYVVILAALAFLLLALLHSGGWWFAFVPFAALAGLGAYDLRQTRHAVRRNYPVIGNLRFFFESIRPELRQYFFEDDTSATPFSRAARSLVYQRAKQ